MACSEICCDAFNLKKVRPKFVVFSNGGNNLPAVLRKVRYPQTMLTLIEAIFIKLFSRENQKCFLPLFWKYIVYFDIWDHRLYEIFLYESLCVGSIINTNMVSDNNLFTCYQLKYTRRGLFRARTFSNFTNSNELQNWSNSNMIWSFFDPQIKC